MTGAEGISAVVLNTLARSLANVSSLTWIYVGSLCVFGDVGGGDAGLFVEATSPPSAKPVPGPPTAVSCLLLTGSPWLTVT